MNDFAGRLQAAMLQAGITTTEELAHRCKLPRQTVRTWTRLKEASISGVRIKLLAECLGVRSEWLIDGTGPMMRRTAEWMRCGKILERLTPHQREHWLAAGEGMIE
jgi:transcriptional regulator with XRE-family HTH domain